MEIQLINAVAEAKRIQRRLARMTDDNRHTDARILIAKTFGYAGSLAELQDIKRQHMKLGHMTHELMQQRLHIGRHMDALIREVSPEAADIVNEGL